MCGRGAFRGHISVVTLILAAFLIVLSGIEGKALAIWTCTVTTGVPGCNTTTPNSEKCCIGFQNPSTGQNYALTVDAAGASSFTVQSQTPTGAPSNVQFPFGVLALNATLQGGTTCITGNVTVTPAYPSLNSYYKQTNAGGWADAIQSIQNSGTKTIITFKACDAGSSDPASQFDLGSSSDGKIVDPGGPSILSSSVPNYSGLGLTLVVMFLAVIGAKALDRAST